MGPFKTHHFRSPAVYSPLITVDKKDSPERRVIMDLSFPQGHSINDHIDTSEYFGTPVRFRYPKIDDLVELINLKGQGCDLMKRDLSRAFRQLSVNPGCYNLLCWTWRAMKYFDKSLIIGMNISPYLCQWVTDAITFIVEWSVFQVVNYVDDLATAQVWDLANDADACLAMTIRECGFEKKEINICAPTAV